jgi:hypothetical protein
VFITPSFSPSCRYGVLSTAVEIATVQNPNTVWLGNVFYVTKDFVQTTANAWQSNGVISNMFVLKNLGVMQIWNVVWHNVVQRLTL